MDYRKNKISRRDFFRNAFASSAIIFSSELGKTKNLPNILLITLDDLNTYVGFMKGFPQGYTSNTDRLAQNSFVFENAYCQYPLCIPSRASMLTGTYPISNGIVSNENLWESTNLITLPQFLKEYGYHTIGLGKVFHNETNRRDVWDVFVKPEYPELDFSINRDKVRISHIFDWGTIDLAEEKFGDFHIANIFPKLIRGNEPWFCSIGFRLPHTPLFTPKGYLDKFYEIPMFQIHTEEYDIDDIPSGGKKILIEDNGLEVYDKISQLGVGNEIRTAYLACIHFADQIIGKILYALEMRSLLRNTIVIITSDNGWHLGEKKHWRKCTLWQQSVQVPLLFHIPGYRPKRIRSAVGLIDIFPTLIHICNLPYGPQSLEGTDLTRLFTSEVANEDIAISQIGCSNFSFRDSQWTFIIYEDGSEELYHRRNDPHEILNLAEYDEFLPVKMNIFGSLKDNIKKKILAELHPTIREKYRL